MNICYINSSYKNLNDANINVFDRGFNFADGVYEVLTHQDGILNFMDLHMKRLNNSLSAVNITNAPSPAILKSIINNLIRMNNVNECMIYIQITKGVVRRKHEISIIPKPSIFICIMPWKKTSKETFYKGIKVNTTLDIRWKRCDIKSISLLANIIAKQCAYNEGFKESLLISESGVVRECSSSNFMVLRNENNIWKIYTHPDSVHILPGITKEIIKQKTKLLNIELIEQEFNLDFVYSSTLAFITASTIKIVPVIQINDFIFNANEIAFDLLYGLYKLIIKED